MAWALWQSAEHRAAKVHVAFAVFPGAPEQVSVTSGNGSERNELRRFVKPGGFYVADRGYANNEMFREFDANDVSFLIRVQQNTTYEILQVKPLTEADLAAGVVSDVLVRRLGTEKHNPLLEKPLRIVKVKGPEPDQEWILATNARELPAELIKIAYQYRWQVELFFRWMKCILGCRHLVSQSQSGVTLQVYAAIIASMLISLWTGTKPSKGTYEMLCHYLSGWASIEELDAHLEKVKNQKPPWQLSRRTLLGLNPGRVSLSFGETKGVFGDRVDPRASFGSVSVFRQRQPAENVAQRKLLRRLGILMALC